MAKSILHVANCDNNLIPKYINFVNERLNEYHNHTFLLLVENDNDCYKEIENVYTYNRCNNRKIIYIKDFIFDSIKSDKIILHGLFNINIILILFLMPWLLNKCYWVIWGGDLYNPQFAKKNWKWRLTEFFRRQVIKNMGNLVTYIKGDYDLAQQWYGAKGKYIECLMYTSNLYTKHYIPEKKHSSINIMVGNSADQMNNHFEIFYKLEQFIEQDIQIYVPLTYGNQEYAQEVIAEGKKLFGDKFKPLTEHMPFEKYLEFLGLIDIAVFNHKRQQAMGNTITLLGLGKKVFLRSDVSQWKFFKSHKIEVFDFMNLEIKLQDKQVKQHNSKIVKDYFSEEKFLQQLNGLFN